MFLFIIILFSLDEIVYIEKWIDWWCDKFEIYLNILKWYLWWFKIIKKLKIYEDFVYFFFSESYSMDIGW